MRQIDKFWWEQIRTKGRARFIFRQGIVPCAIRLGVGFAVMIPVIYLLSSAPPRLFLAVLWASLWAVVSLLVGVLVGIVLWRQHETDYLRLAMDNGKG